MISRLARQCLDRLEDRYINSGHGSCRGKEPRTPLHLAETSLSANTIKISNNCSHWICQVSAVKMHFQLLLPSLMAVSAALAKPGKSESLSRIQSRL